MRLGFALVIYFETFPPLKERFDSQPQPNGLAEWGFDFTFFADPGTHALFCGVGVGALVLYVIGLVPWLALPYLAWFSIATKTLANSQGGISHSYQMVSLILLAQAVVAIWWVLRGRDSRVGPWRTAIKADRLAVYYSQVVIAACYVTAGITKLLNSGGAWLWNTPFLVKDLVKTQRQNFYSQLDVERFGGEVPYVDAMLQHPMWTRILFAPGIFLELAACLALLGRKWALGLGLALIALHAGIDEVMQLNFKVFQLSVLIFLVHPPHWLARVIGLKNVQF